MRGLLKRGTNNIKNDLPDWVKNKQIVKKLKEQCEPIEN